MPRTKVVLVGLPPLLRDVISRLVAEAGAELSRELGGADVVVTRTPAQPGALLSVARPRRVVVLEAGGRRAQLFELVLRRVELDDPSAAELVATLRHPPALGEV